MDNPPHKWERPSTVQADSISKPSISHRVVQLLRHRIAHDWAPIQATDIYWVRDEIPKTVRKKAQLVQKVSIVEGQH